jgi:hypothetical protein
MCADLTRNSGGVAVFNGADHLEKDFAPFSHPGPDANLPIAHRIVGCGTYNATLARTIYTILTVYENKFDVLPACKHVRGCLALLEIRLVTWSTKTAWITLTAGPIHAAPFV